VGLSKSIALDMAKFQVRSNCISPFAWSRMIGSIPTETEDQKARVEKLKAMGFKEAQLYGHDSRGFLGGLNAFFLLLSKPATYGLPDNPKLPQKNIFVDSLLSIGSAVLVGVGALLAFRSRGNGKED
jgi:hypothetical protein